MQSETPSLLTRVRVSRPVGLLRYHLYRDVLLAFPRRHQCNLCGWRGRRFLAFRHEGILCPQCGSSDRHRLIGAAVETIERVRRGVRLDGALVLHFSPEYCLGLLFRPRAGKYVRGDFHARDCDVILDLTKVGVTDGRFDVVVACDVLEHIEDDRAAVREIHRVLRPGGTAILTVPQFDRDQPTLEDPAIATREQRARVYGQEDHVRNYGGDFGARLGEAGFSVDVVEAADFDTEQVQRHVLKPAVPLNGSYGWNRRRIYFARK